MSNVKPIYLYTGPEFGERKDAVEALKKAFKKRVGNNVEEHLYYLVESSFAEVINILENGTLFYDGVFVVCNNAELIKKKDDFKILEQWLEIATDNTTLVLISDEISIDNKVENFIPSEHRKKFWEMFEDKKLPWVLNFFKKNGYKIQSSAAELILDLVENNTEALRNECSRFFVCFPKEHVITEEDVDSILTHDREESAFTLFNEIADCNESETVRFEKGLSILQKIKLSKDNSSVMIIAGLVSCFRKLILWYEKGEQVITGKLMQKQYRKASKVWTKGQATAILADLASADIEIRSSGVLFENIILQKMLYEIVIKKGARLATVDYDS